MYKILTCSVTRTRTAPPPPPPPRRNNNFSNIFCVEQKPTRLKLTKQKPTFLDGTSVNHFLLTGRFLIEYDKG